VIYAVLLIAGVVGLVTLALLGFLHVPGHHGHHHSAHGHLDVDLAGHAHSGHLPAGHQADHGPAPGGGHVSGSSAHSTAGQAASHSNAGHAEPGGTLLWVLPVLSPLNWFSWAIGAGAAGLLLRGVLPEPWLAAAAVAAAVLFNLGVVKPIWRLAHRFASEPAGNLDACLLQTVEAVTSFNARGMGLVRVVIDGRSEDILAQLADEELKQGLRVRRGDRLMIEEIDPQTNSCRVCRG
jgi:hypothetical protein